MTIDKFKDFLWQKGNELYREMPWRQDTRPYYVLVSELMLQQTQVSRVIPKFEAFIAAFPDELALAKASLADVLVMWQGLGYNRRAKFLHESAKYIVSNCEGEWPSTREGLMALPGVGVNTAGALLAYAFNQPSIFIETNVRTVYFYHFFKYQDDVHDNEILPLIEQTIDQEHPREWYWAIMDYGSWLKSQGVRTNTQSTHYKKQSALGGSVREVRGQIIRELTKGDCTEEMLRVVTEADVRFQPALEGLIRDGLVSRSDGGTQLHLTK